MLRRWLVTTLAVLGASPALVAAVPPQAEQGPGGGKVPSTTPGGPDNPGANHPGPDASLPKKAKAYGRYRKDQSKKHVDGEKGTPFSRCVSAGAKLLKDQQDQAAAGVEPDHVVHPAPLGG